MSCKTCGCQGCVAFPYCNFSASRVCIHKLAFVTYCSTLNLLWYCSAGIGKSLAKKLASQGINVILVALHDNLLDATHAELQQAYPVLKFRKVCALCDIWWPVCLAACMFKPVYSLGKPRLCFTCSAVVKEASRVTGLHWRTAIPLCNFYKLEKGLPTSVTASFSMTLTPLPCHAGRRK